MWCFCVIFLQFVFKNLIFIWDYGLSNYGKYSEKLINFFVLELLAFITFLHTKWMIFNLMDPLLAKFKIIIVGDLTEQGTLINPKLMGLKWVPPQTSWNVINKEKECLAFICRTFNLSYFYLQQFLATHHNIILQCAWKIQ